MNELSKILSKFWNSDFWLTPGLKWENLEPKYEYDYADYRHICLYPIIIAVIILLFRYCLEKFLFYRLGLCIGLKNMKSKKASSNVILEKAYKISNKWTHKNIISLCKQTDLSERQIERWLRLRKFQEKPPLLRKFSESCWRCFYYVNIFIYGMVSLWDKSWFWDLDYCWINYPHQGLTNDIWWYYVVSLAFYWSSVISHFFDVKKKDFWQMCTHHVITILLLFFSWMCNLYRIGSVLLVVHDIADAVLDASKVARYAKFDRFCAVLFVCFIIIWTITRLIIYPFWILYSTIVRAPVITQQIFPAYNLFNGLLVALFIIHLYWTYLIFKLSQKALSIGKIKDGVRSSSSEEIA